MRGAKLVFVLLALAAAAFIVWRQVGGPAMSIEEIQHSSDTLVKQELKFLSRGHDYAHYDLTLVGSLGDTARGYYRVPANTRKLPALIWVSDAQTSADPKVMLDGIAETTHCAVIYFESSAQYPRGNDGLPVESEGALIDGLLKCKHSVELFAQFLKKHHVVDSNLVYAGGEGLGLSSVFAAASGSTGKLRGLVCAETGAIQSTSFYAKHELFAPKAWGPNIAPTAMALATTGTEGIKEYLPSTWGCEMLSMRPDAAGEGARTKAAIRSGLEWILKANPIEDDMPGLTDSTKVISVKK